MFRRGPLLNRLRKPLLMLAGTENTSNLSIESYLAVSSTFVYLHHRRSLEKLPKRPKVA